MMKGLDLSPLKDVKTYYSKNIENLERCYKCDWDDKVHDSYSVFVKQTKTLLEEVREISTRTELLAREAEALGVESRMKEADTLCREADAV